MSFGILPWTLCHWKVKVFPKSSHQTICLLCKRHTAWLWVIAHHNFKHPAWSYGDIVELEMTWQKDLIPFSLLSFPIGWIVIKLLQVPHSFYCLWLVVSNMSFAITNTLTGFICLPTKAYKHQELVINPRLIFSLLQQLSGLKTILVAFMRRSCAKYNLNKENNTETVSEVLQ